LLRGASSQAEQSAGKACARQRQNRAAIGRYRFCFLFRDNASRVNGRPVSVCHAILPCHIFVCSFA
jgi:hypothetical protein